MWLTCLMLAAALAADDLPRVDLHVHIDSEENPAKSITPAAAAALSQKLGIKFGVLAEGGCAGDIRDDRTLEEFLRGFEGVPLYRGLQVYGFDWPRCLSKQNRAHLDYIAADALIFPDRSGKNVWLWLAGVKFDDAQDFMERYVDFNVKVLSQPIQVWTNPTYLPESLEARYAELWTPERMRRVITAAVKNRIAIELNTRFRIPSASFVRMAKDAGARFTFGSNGHVTSIGDISYGLNVARQCGLTAKDFWQPAGR
ncbi:MAG TPA: hypothetical protein VN428_10915 [Bryobacteraceae bacterium]|nr:hypothetical protein [Bryobacteraceae bacterium]